MLSLNINHYWKIKIHDVTEPCSADFCFHHRIITVTGGRTFLRRSSSPLSLLFLSLPWLVRGGLFSGVRWCPISQEAAGVTQRRDLQTGTIWLCVSGTWQMSRSASFRRGTGLVTEIRDTAINVTAGVGRPWSCRVSEAHLFGTKKRRKEKVDAAVWWSSCLRGKGKKIVNRLTKSRPKNTVAVTQPQNITPHVGRMCATIICCCSVGGVERSRDAAELLKPFSHAWTLKTQTWMLIC